MMSLKNKQGQNSNLPTLMEFTFKLGTQISYNLFKKGKDTLKGFK